MRHVVHSTEDLIELLAKEAGVKVERARIRLQEGEQLDDGWMITMPEPVDPGVSVEKQPESIDDARPDRVESLLDEVQELQGKFDSIEHRMKNDIADQVETLSVTRERLLCIELLAKKAGAQVEHVKIRLDGQQIDGYMVTTSDPVKTGLSVSQVRPASQKDDDSRGGRVVG